MLDIIENKYKDTVIIDVRIADEYQQRRVLFAVNISQSAILKGIFLLLIYKNQTMIIYRHSGVRAGKVMRLLDYMGYQNYEHLKGDMLGWISNKQHVEK